MKDTIDKGLQRLNWKHWMLFLLISQGIFMMMQHYTMPIIAGEAGGMSILDAQPLGYSYDYVVHFLEQLSPRGYTYYQWIQLPLDVLYPMMNFILSITTLGILKGWGEKVDMRIASLWMTLPFIGMLSDYMENVIIALMLADREHVVLWLVRLCSSLTIIKSSAVMLFYGVCLIFGVRIGIIKMLQIKKGRGQNHDNI